jgi:hypothetical protein
MWSTFWRMVAAVVQHAADRELFVVGELAAANRSHKTGCLSREGCVFWSEGDISSNPCDVRFTPEELNSVVRGYVLNLTWRRAGPTL